MIMRRGSSSWSSRSSRSSRSCLCVIIPFTQTVTNCENSAAHGNVTLIAVIIPEVGVLLWFWSQYIHLACGHLLPGALVLVTRTSSVQEPTSLVTYIIRIFGRHVCLHQVRQGLVIRHQLRRFGKDIDSLQRFFRQGVVRLSKLRFFRQGVARLSQLRFFRQGIDSRQRFSRQGVVCLRQLRFSRQGVVYRQSYVCLSQLRFF